MHRVCWYALLGWWQMQCSECTEAELNVLYLRGQYDASAGYNKFWSGHGRIASTFFYWRSSIANNIAMKRTKGRNSFILYAVRPLLYLFHIEIEDEVAANALRSIIPNWHDNDTYKATLGTPGLYRSLFFKSCITTSCKSLLRSNGPKIFIYDREWSWLPPLSSKFVHIAWEHLPGELPVPPTMLLYAIHCHEPCAVGKDIIFYLL